MKRFALICGASGEIGSSIARRLAGEGWSLYLHYNATPVTQLLAELAAIYPEQEFLPVQANLAELGAADKLASQLYSLQTVVFASGQAYYELLEDSTEEMMEQLWRVHVQNPMLLLRAISSKLRQCSPSYVVFISSIWGSAGAAGEVVYSTVKGAQQSFVKAYAQEVAFNGIRVNAIAPGFIDTKMNQQLSEEERLAVLDQIPMYAAGTPQDIANGVYYLVSGQADYMTGQTLHINGGWYM